MTRIVIKLNNYNKESRITEDITLLCNVFDSCYFGCFSCTRNDSACKLVALAIESTSSLEWYSGFPFWIMLISKGMLS